MHHPNSSKATFILVEPQVPENIGFICRCLKNMGFSDLRIVGTSKDQIKDAHVTAYQAHDILSNIKFFDNLAVASADLDLLVGTTAKARKNRDQLINSRALKEYLVDRNQHVGSFGIVFGSESNGLSHKDERLCHVLSTIPMQTSYPSINLSHSLMIYAYELSQNIDSRTTNTKDEKIPFKVYDEQIQLLLKEKQLDQRQPELYQRTIDSLRLIPSQSIPLVMSLLRYFKR